jgi:hypothetical protein
MPHEHAPRITGWQGPLLLAVLLAVALPLAALLLDPGALLGHPDSELPVRLWGLESFGRGHWFGGLVTSVGHPNAGAHANPDPLGSLVYGLLSPVLGRVLAYDTLILGTCALNGAAAWWLVRDQVRDSLAAVTGAVCIACAPFLLAYALGSAVLDLLQLWPWLLALTFGLRALRRPGWGAGLRAGLAASLGVVACAYHAPVLGLALIPGLALLPLALREGLTPVPDPTADASWRQVLRGGVAVLIPLLPLAGGYALWVLGTIDDPQGQMSREILAQARHHAPWSDLHPGPESFVASLADYLAVGPAGLRVREAGSRFMVVVAPGLGVLGLGALGVLACQRQRSLALWLAVAAIGALASTGPFLALTPLSALQAPLNPAWWAARHLVPGGGLVLEPFRYSLLVVLGLSVPAALGALLLVRRLGTWIGWLLPLVLMGELVAISPLPAPLPVTHYAVSPAYDRLDELLGPGALVELPYWSGDSRRFCREHFLHQLHHRRPILDEVAGFPARYLRENPLLATAVMAEGLRPGQEVRPGAPPEQGVEQLRLDGFAGVVVDPSGYASTAGLAAALEALALLGSPVELEDRLVFVLRSPEP